MWDEKIEREMEIYWKNQEVFIFNFDLFIFKQLMKYCEEGYLDEVMRMIEEGVNKDYQNKVF